MLKKFLITKSGSCEKSAERWRTLIQRSAFQRKNSTSFPVRFSQATTAVVPSYSSTRSLVIRPFFAQPFGHRIVIKVVTDPIGEAWDAMIRRTAFAGPKQISKGNLPLSPDNKVNLTWA
jgi:hypothetical protein